MVVAFAITTALDDPIHRTNVHPVADITSLNPSIPSAKTSVNDTEPRSVWELLALSDDELEKVDIIELNLAVAREIPGLEHLDIAKYQRIVDEWANDIRPRLPAAERVFAQTPEKWLNDVRFFRLGVVSSYLNEYIGIAYIDEQKQAQIDARKTGAVAEIRYTDPGNLFVHDLIDNKRGTCGNMPILHVAIGRRLGWPVFLAAVESHTVCRFDDGEFVYNIETTHTEQGGMFSAGTDAEYIKNFDLPQRAVTCGSDLHSMTARQMLGHFISLRARYFADIDQMDRADRDYALARALLPNQRCIWHASMQAAVFKGTQLFNPGEPEGPTGLAYWLNDVFASPAAGNNTAMQNRIDEVQRINEITRMIMKQRQMPGVPTPNGPGTLDHFYLQPVPNRVDSHQPFNPHGPMGSP